jgi:hypothetical protein
VRLERGMPSVEGGGATCPLRAVCGKWRAPDACARCRHGSRPSTSQLGRAARAPGSTAMPAQPAPAPVAAAAPRGERARLAWRVHHDLPLRTRYRLVGGPARASADAVEALALAVPGVRAARFTAETGSLLVEHDGAEATRRSLACALDQASPRDLAARPGEPRRSERAGAPEGAVKAVVLSLLTAALPPAPLVAFTLVRSLAAPTDR